MINDVNKLNIYHEVKAMRYLQSVIMSNLISLGDYLVDLQRDNTRGLNRLEELLQRKEKEERKENKEQEKVSQTLLKEKEKKEKKEEREKKLTLFPEKLEFQFFSLSSKKYNALVREYGADVVNDSCVILDKLIGLSGRSYKKVDAKLTEICINLAMRDSLTEKLSYTANTIRKVEYKLIDNLSDARKYYLATPSYLRRVDKGCVWLVSQFPELEGEAQCT